MKKLVFCISILGLLNSCANDGTNSGTSAASDSSGKTVDTAISKVFPEKLQARFYASVLINFNKKNLSWGDRSSIDVDSLTLKKNRALSLLDSIVNLYAFRENVLNGSYSHTNGLNNEQIFEEFFGNKHKNIREHLTLAIDTSWLWNVKYQNRKHPSIGYDNAAGDSIVHTVQVQLVKYLSPEDYAAHIAHEYCHMIGFSHPNPNKWQGVPYGIQHIVERMLTGSVKPENEAVE
jgi:hypothetical protein